MTDNQDSDSEELLMKLEIIGDRGRFLWKMFFLCMTPSILNGLNLTSYIFLAEVPQHWCSIRDLQKTNWTEEQIRSISSPGGSNGSSCSFYDWNYRLLSSMSYEEALNYVSEREIPNEKPCEGFAYSEGASSMVVDHDLVCDRLALKSTVQVVLSLGKFLGAFFFGMLSDKYGRRLSFLMGSLLYILSGPIVSFACNYVMIIVGRIGLGAAGSGIYHSASIILFETAGKRHRASLGILFNLCYPIGQMIGPLVAYFIRDWRNLQLSISVPALLILLFYWFLPESPRWLISTGKKKEAAKIINGVYSEMKCEWEANLRFRENHELAPIDNFKERKQYAKMTPTQSSRSHGKSDSLNAMVCLKPRSNLSSTMRNVWMKLCSSVNQLSELVKYSELRYRLLITLFLWCICSLCYYALALNVDNFHTNRYVYVFLTGLVELPSYFLPLPFLRYLGRRQTAILLFYAGGIALVCILAIPRSHEYKLTILVVAFVGRLCASGVFAVVILQTTELFPTVVRNTAIGCGSTAAHIGSMSAPLLVDLLGAYAWFIPSTVCGVATLLAGTLIFLIPETKNKPLPDTVQEIVDSSEKEKVGFHQICR